MAQHPTGPEDAELARAARLGDQRAFRTLALRYEGPLFRMAYARLRSRADAEDVVQDVFLKAWRTIGELREDGSVKAWLYRVAVNRVRDLERMRLVRGVVASVLGHPRDRDGPEESVDPADPGADVSADVAARQFWERVRLFAERLARLEREVFLLRFADGLAIAEIALALGKNEGAVKTTLCRAVAKFRNDPEFIAFLRSETS